MCGWELQGIANSVVTPKGLPLAKSEASNSHGSVPFLSKLGDIRVRYIRKERTKSGHNISCAAANIHTAQLSLLALFSLAEILCISYVLLTQSVTILQFLGTFL